MKIQRSRSFIIVAGGFSIIVMLIFGLLLWHGGMFAGTILLVASALSLLAVGVFAFSDRQPVIQLTEQGIILHRCNAVTVFWTDIDTVFIERWPRGGRFLVIKLKSNKHSPLERCRYATVRHRDSRVELILIAEGLSVPPGLIVNKINEYLGALG